MEIQQTYRRCARFDFEVGLPCGNVVKGVNPIEEWVCQQHLEEDEPHTCYKPVEARRGKCGIDATWQTDAGWHMQSTRATDARAQSGK